jgi:hypothetical protein
MTKLFDNGDVQVATRVQRFEVQLPGRRLRCNCGHQLAAFDFYVDEPHSVRAVCSACHTELLIIEFN